MKYDGFNIEIKGGLWISDIGSFTHLMKLNIVDVKVVIRCLME